MAQGNVRKLSTWDQCVHELRVKGCRFRIRRIPRSDCIYVREYLGGRVVRDFSVKPYRHDDDAHVALIRDRCLKAHESGRWPSEAEAVPGEAVPNLTWATLATLCRRGIEARIVKEGSRVHAVNHLVKVIGRFSGPVSARRLEDWVLEISPVEKLHQFNRRIETLSQMNKAGVLDLSESLSRLRALRPKGAAEKIRKASSQKVRVIPADAELEAWLDQLEPFLQWVFATIATYGLRPHELWHAEGIDEDGWLTIPGDLRTKTARHFAPPAPSGWLSRLPARCQLGALPRGTEPPLAGALAGSVGRSDRDQQHSRLELPLQGVPAAGGSRSCGHRRQRAKGWTGAGPTTCAMPMPSDAPPQRRPASPLTRRWPAGWGTAWMSTSASTCDGSPRAGRRSP
jgi:hypothetical protein